MSRLVTLGCSQDIFIGSLIFVEELALKMKAAVEKQRDRMDAVLLFPLMPEVMRLNKLGSFSMSQPGQSKSPFFQLFKNKKKSSAGFSDQMLKLVRTLPKVLKYLPSDKAQDARLYIPSLLFWLGGSPDNLVNFVKMISGSYVPALKGMQMAYSDPVVFLDTGIWHPLAPYVRSVDPVLPFGSYIRYLLMKDSTVVLSDLFGIIVLERCRLLLMKIWNINISVHGKCIVRHAWKSRKSWTKLLRYTPRSSMLDHDASQGYNYCARCTVTCKNASCFFDIVPSPANFTWQLVERE
ncbi:hypothetical protein L2E82_17247 [Cichorium intybus]|uniref:Uncharacterized protein n=1 Tax=Cichorium intybus TaxID=13427 RepID=A0ACB9F7R1_CICIN|nr:hypothetical protein L2E82_17247 [Cichorium intybus]